MVRERYWLTFQPGEIRSCASCHGVNRHDQTGNPPPMNEPEALRSLLRSWKAQNGPSNVIRITSTKRGTAGKLSLQTASPPSQVLILETSTDLRLWNPIRTNTVDNAGAANWDLDLSAGSNSGFFRITGR